MREDLLLEMLLSHPTDGLRNVWRQQHSILLEQDLSQPQGHTDRCSEDGQTDSFLWPRFLPYISPIFRRGLYCCLGQLWMVVLLLLMKGPDELARTKSYYYEWNWAINWLPPISVFLRRFLCVRQCWFIGIWKEFFSFHSCIIDVLTRLKGPWTFCLAMGLCRLLFRSIIGGNVLGLSFEIGLTDSTWNRWHVYQIIYRIFRIVVFLIHSCQTVLYIDGIHRLGLSNSRIITCLVLKLEQFYTREQSLHGPYMRSPHHFIAEKDYVNPSDYMMKETLIPILVIKCSLLLNYWTKKHATAKLS